MDLQIIHFLILFLGLLLGLIFKNFLKNIFFKIKSFWSIIPGFWWTTLILVVLFTVSYILIFKLSSDISLDTNISLANTIITLTFAIFIGYYAFIQVAENRAERDLIQGRSFLYRKPPEFVKAMYYYESAIKFKIKDFPAAAELLEIYLVNNETKKFLELLKKIENKEYNKIIDKYDNLIIFYLKIAKECFCGDTQKVKFLIREAIKYVEKNPDSTRQGIWSFSEIQTSSPYSSLEVTSDSKKYLDNFILFITNNLGDKKEKFIQGNFRLD